MATSFFQRTGRTNGRASTGKSIHKRKYLAYVEVFKKFYTEGKCSVVVTVDELLKKYRSAEMPERDRGAKFERLMKNFLLTNPVYWEKLSAELKKSLPRIILSERFWEFSRAGRDLAEIHLNYETQPPAKVEIIGGGDFRVKKLRFACDDRTTLIYNDFITIKNIPPRCFEYVVNGCSLLEWIIDRYQIKTDSASGIINNPNDWATEHDKPRYILDLILSCITVSLKTLDIVENLPEIDF